MNGTIVIVNYDPLWAQHFDELKSVFGDVLKEKIIAVEHVGSTAVPGLPAKPILDIDLIVKDIHHVNKIIPILALMGYQFAGNQGIKDRYVFKALSDLSPDQGTGKRWPKHHLYCCPEGCVSLKNHILFRNELRHSEQLAAAYGELKQKSAAATTDMEVYVELKSSFIADVLERAGVSASQLSDIISQNKKK